MLTSTPNSQSRRWAFTAAGVLLAAFMVAGCASTDGGVQAGASAAASSSASTSASVSQGENPGSASPDVPLPAGFQYRTDQVNGLDMQYLEGGQGDQTVVLLHGFPATSYSWVPILPELGRNYRVIAPDLRGLDVDGLGTPTSGFDKRTMAGDVNALLLAKGVQRAAIVGHDIGAMVAYAYAKRYGEQTTHLVFLDAGLPGFGLEQFYTASFHFLFNQAAGNPDGRIPIDLVRGRELIYFELFYRDEAVNKAAISPEEKNVYVRAYQSAGALEAAFGWYRAFPEDARANQADAQPKLQMPVLALGGDGGLRTIPVDTMRQLADNVTGGVVPNAGHWVQNENAGFVSQQIAGLVG